MRIEDMRKKAKEVAFENIETGECFIDWDGDLCMKTTGINHHNAITLANGFLWTCDENTLVTPVKTHIVIEQEETKK